jgi:hypothetical protein
VHGEGRLGRWQIAAIVVSIALTIVCCALAWRAI